MLKKTSHLLLCVTAALAVGDFFVPIRVAGRPSPANQA
jgi:hypothetical protein